MKPFTYADYEEALRDPTLIAGLQRRFVARFTGVDTVLDLGCGRGIFLDLLRAAGIGAVGVDREPGLVREACAAGHRVIEADIFAFLSTTDLRFGGVFCSHLLEHLPFPEVLRLIEGVARCLRRGGVFVAVFPNPESIRMQLSGFWKDPDHVRFYHPDLIGAVCAHYGLEVVGGSAEDPAPNRLGAPWLAGVHLDGCRLPDAAPADAEAADGASLPSPGAGAVGGQPDAAPVPGALARDDPVADAEAADGATPPSPGAGAVGGQPEAAPAPGVLARDDGLGLVEPGPAASRPAAGQDEACTGRRAPVVQRWMNARLDAYYPRREHVDRLLAGQRGDFLRLFAELRGDFLRLLAELRGDLLATLATTVAREADESRRISGAIEAELRAARAAVDRIVDLQERMLAGVAVLNANIERFNAEVTIGVDAFNHRLGPLVDALNAVWAAPDEAVLVCRKTGAGAVPGGDGA